MNALPCPPRAVWVLLLALGLGACEDPQVGAVSAPKASTAAVVATPTPQPTAPPGVSGLSVASAALIGAESFEVSFNVDQPGNGTLVQYGLKTRVGSQVFALKPAIPVIANGHVKLAAIGPLPTGTEGGDFDCELWVIDGAGHESNHLPFKMKIQ